MDGSKPGHVQIDPTDYWSGGERYEAGDFRIRYAACTQSPGVFWRADICSKTRGKSAIIELEEGTAETKEAARSQFIAWLSSKGIADLPARRIPSDRATRAAAGLSTGILKSVCSNYFNDMGARPEQAHRYITAFCRSMTKGELPCPECHASSSSGQLQVLSRDLLQCVSCGLELRIPN